MSILLLSAAVASGSAAAADQTSRLSYDVEEGLNLNRFIREKQVAAHLVLRSGHDPRLLIAFPAGNSGVGVWFEHLDAAAHWRSDQPLQAVHQLDEQGRALYGIAASVSIDAPQLQVRQAVLSSVRVLRDYQSLGKVSDELTTAPASSAHAMRWSRQRLDGKVSYRLVIEITRGMLHGNHISAGANGRIALRVTGLTGEPPLEPLAESELLSAAAAPDETARHALTFLSFRQKLLAGSWRFDTYFGRDTLMSVRLLMPALSASAVESGLSSVLLRLSPQGEVAHEEDIGERAVLDHLQADGSRSAAPVYDYKMIDGNYLLAPVAVGWLLHDERGRARAASFLAGSIEAVSGRAGTRGAALLENLRFVVHSAAAFATEPAAANLIGLKPGFAVGEWRDSETGLGGGHYPFDVNAVLVPAALDAVAQLQASGLLQPYQNAADTRLFAQAGQMAATWRTRAPPLFQMSIESAAASQAVRQYAAALSVPAARAGGAFGADGGVHFHALALTAAGAPVPVMNSDEGFALLFGQPEAAQMDRDVTTLMRPFPAGLMTDAGMLVANPVFAQASLRAQFGRNAYHGTVVWSWQQALFAAGLSRQLERQDLPAPVRMHLLEAQRQLWTVIRATRSMSNSELWSWSFTDGRFAVAPFGAAAGDADESNAAQLWSTVYLAVQPPVDLKP